MSQAERARHGGRDKLRTRQGAEFGDEYTIGKSGQKVPRDFQGQSRLTDAAGADQADQPVLSGQSCDFFELGFPTDQLRNRLRKIRLPRGEKEGRRSGVARISREPRLRPASLSG